MSDLKTLTGIFDQSLYRIPDYQRGYAWERRHFEAFWFDLLNLTLDRKHYTGVLTLKRIDPDSISADENEHWLAVDNGYKLYQVIDGQQRLTTCVILIEALIECLRSYHPGKPDSEITFNSQFLSKIVERFLYETTPNGAMTTYKFGYENKNPSFDYFKHHILLAPGAGTVKETFYTLNLGNAKTYFLEQLQALAGTERNIAPLEEIYRKLTTRFQFNPYEIPSDFDEFVAFETMNNRGKSLSNLELLKNRLIYLVSLYSDKEASPANRASLRELINDAWQEVYTQIGRNKKHRLNDDDFLRAHWIIDLTYSRRRGDDYADYLLNRYFTINSILKKKPIAVSLEEADEYKDEDEEVIIDENGENETAAPPAPIMMAELPPAEIRRYAESLKETSLAWYRTWFPFDDVKNGFDAELASWIDKLNRLGMQYCRPLVASILLKKENSNAEKVEVLKALERFLFIAFRLNRSQSNFKSSDYYINARKVYKDELTLPKLLQTIQQHTEEFFKDGKFYAPGFKRVLSDRFENRRPDGFYHWSGLPYFLYEHELELMASRGVKRLDWEPFTRFEKDKFSIEHIFPQTPKDPYWIERFKDFDASQKERLSHSLGNLLPLSLSINISLQNESFPEKKRLKKNEDGSKVLRNGYLNGSYSEQAVSEKEHWNAAAILERGMALLAFMERRWDISLGDEGFKLELLNVEFLREVH